MLPYRVRFLGADRCMITVDRPSVNRKLEESSNSFQGILNSLEKHKRPAPWSIQDQGADRRGKKSRNRYRTSTIDFTLLALPDCSRAK
jgi:hypothetical protein